MTRLLVTFGLGAACLAVAGSVGAQPTAGEEQPEQAAEPATESSETAGEPAGTTESGETEATEADVSAQGPMQADGAGEATGVGAVPAAAAETGDRISYRVSVDAVAHFFRRSVFPTPGGALVEGDTAVPFYHFAMLRVDDIDAPWAEDSIDAELAVWGNLQLADDGAPFGDAGRLDGVGRLDGDVQIAMVRQRFGFGRVELGRMVRAGGAARFVRYDGASVGVRAPFGLGADAYGGFTVLPRWDARPGYHLLGSAADTLIRHDLETIYPNPDREKHWLVGGRAFYDYETYASVGVSFHEQRAQEGLERRNAGFDARVRPIEEIMASGQVVLDADATNVADARAAIDTFPVKGLNVSAVYLHVAPALMMSRQSVLSVFSTEAFNEWGLESGLRPVRWLSLGASGYIERFEMGDVGARGGGNLRFYHFGETRVVLGVGYRRVVEVENGYHSMRATATVEPPAPVDLTADAFVYLYDEKIRNWSSSWVGALSAGVKPTETVKLVVGGSLATSPFAKLDAQALARVAVLWEGETR